MTCRTLPTPTYIVPTVTLNHKQYSMHKLLPHTPKTSCCSCSVAKSHPTLCEPPSNCFVTPCDPMEAHQASLHYLPEFAQAHVHRVTDAIQPSYPLSPPSLPAFNLSQIKVFYSESALCIRWPKYWSFSFSMSPFNEHLGLFFLRIDWFDLLAAQGTLKSLL